MENILFKKKKFLKTLFVIGAVLFLPAMAFANPVIFYTDILSGPNSGTNDGPGGCYLTISGKGFGSTQGSSTVTIGGGAVGTYKYWSDTKVSVQLGSSSATGNIVMTTSEGSAIGSDQFTVRSGDIYFVSLTGSDGGASAAVNDISMPYRSPNYVKGLGSFGPGDFIVIRGGNYDLDDGNNGLYLNSWVRGSKSGSSGNPLTVSGYPGETVILQVDSKVAPFIIPNGGFSHWVFANFNVDVTTCNHGSIIQIGASALGARCTNDPDASEGAGNIRIVNIDVTGNDTGLLCGEGGGFNPIVVAYAHDVKLFGVFVHNGGPLGEPECRSHTFYLSATQRNVEIGWSGIYNMPNGRAHLQIHQDSFGGACWGSKIITNIYIHDSIFYNLRGQPVLMDGSTGDIWFYNNIIYDSHRNGANYPDIISLRGGGGKLNARLYNNTVYVNPAYTDEGRIISFGGPSGYDPETVVLYNNIFYVTESRDAYYHKYHRGWDLGNVTANNNVWYGSSDITPPFAGAEAVTSDPLFTDPDNNDLTLQSSSPCLNAGTDTGDVSPHVTTWYNLGAGLGLSTNFVEPGALDAPMNLRIINTN